MSRSCWSTEHYPVGNLSWVSSQGLCLDQDKQSQIHPLALASGWCYPATEPFQWLAAPAGLRYRLRSRSANKVNIYFFGDISTKQKKTWVNYRFQGLTGLAVTLDTTLMAGRVKLTVLSANFNSSAAGCIKLQWNGALRCFQGNSQKNGKVKLLD